MNLTPERVSSSLMTLYELLMVTNKEPQRIMTEVTYFIVLTNYWREPMTEVTYFFNGIPENNNNNWRTHRKIPPSTFSSYLVLKLTIYIILEMKQGQKKVLR